VFGAIYLLSVAYRVIHRHLSRFRKRAEAVLRPGGKNGLETPSSVQKKQTEESHALVSIRTDRRPLSRHSIMAE
jgi:hypothetical protein